MTTEETFTPELYFLLHHGILLEWTNEPVENRLEYIQKHKPASEVPIRMEWLRKVQHPERLPQAVLQAGADWRKAEADWRKAEADWDRAAKNRDKVFNDLSRAITANWDAIVALHKEECPGCPFDYEGTKELIFPK